jgi:hypothetical protein
MLFIFFLVSVIFFLFSSNLLISLILLELLSFIVLFFSIGSISNRFSSDFLVLLFFSVFVMEGVIALSGLILLVSFTGSDYVRSFSFSAC